MADIDKSEIPKLTLRRRSREPIEVEAKLNSKIVDWFSKIEDYDISSSKLGNDEPSFETKYGIHHEIHSDGTSHTTNWDAESNTRYSWDTDANGNRNNEHPTDQNKSKGDPDRH